MVSMFKSVTNLALLLKTLVPTCYIQSLSAWLNAVISYLAMRVGKNGTGCAAVNQSLALD